MSKTTVHEYPLSIEDVDCSANCSIEDYARLDGRKDRVGQSHDAACGTASEPSARVSGSGALRPPVLASPGVRLHGDFNGVRTTPRIDVQDEDETIPRKDLRGLQLEIPSIAVSERHTLACCAGHQSNLARRDRFHADGHSFQRLR